MLMKVTIALETHSIDKTVEFWSKVLGFDCSGSYSDQWVELSRDAVSVMFSSPNQHQGFEKPYLTGALYLETDDVDTEWEEIGKKADVCYEIENFDYGMREFGVFDNNGYLIQFGQRIEK